MAMSELNRRRWRNFRRNGRAFWSLVIFAVLFVVAMFAEVVANDKPVVVSYRGDLYWPAYNFYPETTFGGDFGTEAIYRDEAVQCLIVSGGRGLGGPEPFELLKALADTMGAPRPTPEFSKCGMPRRSRVRKAVPSSQRGWVIPSQARCKSGFNGVEKRARIRFSRLADTGTSAVTTSVLNPARCTRSRRARISAACLPG